MNHLESHEYQIRYVNTELCTRKKKRHQEKMSPNVFWIPSILNFEIALLIIASLSCLIGFNSLSLAEFGTLENMRLIP